MTRVEDLRGFVTERLTTASQEILAAVDRVVARYEAEASGFRQEIERQRNLLDVVLQPRVVLNKTGVKRSRHLGHTGEEGGEDEVKKSLDRPPSRAQFKQRKQDKPQISETQNHADIRIHVQEEPQPGVLPKNGDQQLSIIKVEDPPELTTSLDQGNLESLFIKEEKEELLTTPEFPLTSVRAKSEDEEEKPQSIQPHQRQTEAEPPSSSSAEQTEADGDDCGGSEPARNLKGEKPQSSQLHREYDHPKRQMEVHTGEKPSVSSVCGSTCKMTGNLGRHMKSSAEENPSVCHFCGKIFSRQEYLRIHTRIHTGEKPYSCSYCGKRFTHPAGLRVHRRTHTGEKPYGCNFCDHRFTDGSNLKKHLKNCKLKKAAALCEAEGVD